MGWLFGWDDRKSLIRHLTEGNGVKTLKKALIGNDMWCVHESQRDTGEIVRWACLYMLRRGHANGPHWGYKDVDESMGPNHTNFPHSYLALLTEPINDYSRNWRGAVQRRNDLSKSVTVGSKWKYGGVVYEIIRRRNPTSFLVTTEGGFGFKMKLDQFFSAEKINGNTGSTAGTDGNGSGPAHYTLHGQLSVAG